MKYLFVIPTDKLGGAEQLIKLVATECMRQDHKVEILCLTAKSKTNGWCEFEGMVTYFNTNNTYIGFLKIPIWLKGKTFDLAMSSQVYINGALGLFKKYGFLKTKKLVVRESTSVFHQLSGIKLSFYTVFYKIGYRYVDLLIYQSKVMKNQLESNIKKIKKLNSIVLDNPLDLDGIIEKSNENIQNENSYNQNYLLAVGRLIPLKRFDLLIKGFSIISIKNPDLCLVILGEGNQRPILEKQITDLNLRDKVFLPGFVSNPFPYMKQAKVCIISSEMEGFPNTLLQMMALNENVITTLCAGGIEDIPFVEKIPINNIEKLQESITKLLHSQNSDSTFERHQYLRKRDVANYVQNVVKK